jgi:PAS domain S-box-containing protein
MNLRGKTLLTLSLAFIVIIFILLIFSSGIFLKSYQNLETSQVSETVRLVDTNVKNEISNLNSIVQDWGPWDEEYAFAEGNNKGFVKLNLVEETYKTLRLNFIVITDKNGNVLYAQGFNLETNEFTDPPPRLINELANKSSPLLTVDKNKQYSGFLTSPEGSVILASYPILHSDYTGPQEGTVFMGRNLDSYEINKLALSTVPSLEIVPFQNSSVTPDEYAILNAAPGSSVLVVPRNDKIIEGSLLLKDIFGEDALLLRLQAPRDIFQHGKNTLLAFTLILGLVAMIIGIVVIFIIDRFVLSRLTKLSQEVDQIGTRGDISSSVTIDGEDEITHLADALNTTLRKLESAQSTLQKSEERYRSLVETSPVGIIVAFPDGTITYCNERTSMFLGYESVNNLIGKNVLDLIQPDNHGYALQLIQEVIHSGSIWYKEIIALKSDGTPFRLEINASLIRNPAGEPESIIIVTQDVSKRVENEAAIKKSESYYKAIFENTGNATIIVNEDTIITHANSEFEQLSGYTKEETENKKSWMEFVHKEDLEKVIKFHQLRKSNPGLVPGRYNLRVIHKNGDVHYAINTVETIPGTTDIVASLLDITDSKKIHDSLAENENYLKALLSSIQVGIFVIDAESHCIIDANPAALAMIGVDSKEIVLNKKCHSFVCPAMEGRCPITDLGLSVDNAERELLTCDGRVIQIIKHVVPVMLGGKPCLLETFIDNTERKKMEKAVRESEEKYRNILERIQDGYYRSDAEGHLILASPSVASALGYDSVNDLYGKSIADFLYLDPEKRKDFLKKIGQNGEIANYEVEIKKRDGKSLIVSTSSHFYFDPEGKFLGIEGVCRDVTEVRKTEAALRESEARYRELVELLPQTIFEADLSGKIVSTNRVGFEMFGYEREGAQYGVNALDLLEPEDRERAAGNLMKVINGENIGAIEYTVHKKDGTRFPVLISATPVIRDNKVTGIIGIIVDITERKKIDDALRESEEKYRFISENSNDLTYTLDLEGRFTHISTQIRQYGFTPEDFLGHSFKEFVEKEDLEKVVADAIKTIASGEKSLTVFRARDKAGVVHWVEDNSNAILDNTGTVIGIVGVMREISERKKAEEAIKEREQFLKRLIEAISNPIFYKDTDGRFTGCNAAYEKFIGLSKDQILGKTVFDIAPDDLAEIYSAKEKELLEHQGIQNFEAKVRHADGTLHDVIFNKVSLSDVNGKIEGIVGFIVDITEHRQMEDAIRLANKKLNLLNNITRHDILNTITGLFGLEAIALDMADTKELRELIGEINDNTKRMQQQITFTRDYQDIGVRSPTWQNVAGTIVRATDIINLAKTELVISTEDYEIYADPLLERVFYNLVENSLKYGGSLTKITFSSYLSFNGLVIACEDDGSGIRVAEKELIFEQGFGKHTGLGLFLSREILGITGISIRETGIPGHGARFEILVPPGKYRAPRGGNRNQ